MAEYLKPTLVLNEQWIQVYFCKYVNIRQTFSVTKTAFYIDFWLNYQKKLMQVSFRPDPT